MPDYSYRIFKVLCILKKDSCVDIRVDIIDKDKSFMSRHVARLIIRWGCVVQVQWVSLNILEGGASLRYKQAIFKLFFSLPRLLLLFADQRIIIIMADFCRPNFIQ